MGITTDIITYNVKELGRSFSGQKRAFNIEAFTRLVNGSKAQEAVKSGDMVGYLGHDIRRNFGLRPPEVALNNGKLIPIEPAFTTCYLKAYADGTVEHQERFLDTPLGQVAQEWHTSKTGGFSSVVAPDERQPTDFLGFDYVRSPNFNRNRGYVMDSSDDEWGQLTNKQKITALQEAQLEQTAVFDAMVQSFNQLTQAGQYQAVQSEQMLNAIAQLESEAQTREQLLREAQWQVAQNAPRHEPMMRLSVGQANWLEGALASFDSTQQHSPRRYAVPASVLKYFR
jgi:hypothetical protein